MDHDDPWTIGKHSNAYFHEYGGWGVFLFFAISGLLVCTRILQDEAKTGRFRLGSFYIRRFFRIQPAATAYIAVIALLTMLGIVHERASALFGALFMYQNYLFNITDVSGRWFLTGHFWTLAVEEHFYLLLSLLLYCFHRYRIAAFATVISIIFLWQRIVVHYGLYNPDTSARRTDGMLDFLLVPALLALYLQRAAFLKFAQVFLLPWVVFSATLFLKLCAELIDPVPPDFRKHVLAILLHHPPLWFYSCGFWVMATMLHPRSLTTRILEWRPLRFLGRLSYSIYLWHPIFFFATNPKIDVHASWLFFLGARPWRYLATLGAALVSYYFVEKPMIRLGHRLAPPATPGHADLRGEPPVGVISPTAVA